MKLFPDERVQGNIDAATIGSLHDTFNERSVARVQDLTAGKAEGFVKEVSLLLSSNRRKYLGTNHLSNLNGGKTYTPSTGVYQNRLEHMNQHNMYRHKSGERRSDLHLLS